MFETINTTIKTHLKPLLFFASPFALVIAALSFLESHSHATGMYWFVNLSFLANASALSPVVIIYLSLARYGQHIIRKEVYYEAFLYIPYIFAVGLLVSVPYFLLGMFPGKTNPSLMLAALFLFILVSIYLAFTDFLITLEEYKPVAAIRDSVRYTSKHIVAIVKYVFIFVLPLAIPNWIVSILRYVATNEPSILFFSLLNGFFSYLISVVFTIVLFEIYLEDYKERKQLSP